jgi:hypothetical protein
MNNKMGACNTGRYIPTFYENKYFFLDGPKGLEKLPADGHYNLQVIGTILFHFFIKSVYA